MSDDTVWSEVHKDYRESNWIDRPSLFATEAVTYFPVRGKILELGAGQGQDSRYFAEHEYEVVSTDFEEMALEQSRIKLSSNLSPKLTISRLDIREQLPFEDETFDVVYAHLSLHYFDSEMTSRIFTEIYRVLKKDGILAFLANSTSDPEYSTGIKLETDYFMIDKTAKRYFNVGSAKLFAKKFTILLADNKGETYKDRAKGVHQLIRFIGKK